MNTFWIVLPMILSIKSFHVTSQTMVVEKEHSWQCCRVSSDDVEIVYTIGNGIARRDNWCEDGTEADTEWISSDFTST